MKIVSENLAPDAATETTLGTLAASGASSATAANQTLEIASLATLHTDLGLLATATLQTAGNASLTAIAAKDFATQVTLALVKAKTDNLDVLLSTRLKPADTLAGVTTVAAVTSITNPVAVTGTFWQATQPISAASLPLPSGATTETTLSGLSAKFGTLGQKASSGSAPVVMSSDGPGMTIASPLYIAFSTGLVSSFGLTVDGGGSPPTTGSKGYATVPYAGTIIKWWITSDVAGSCVVDLKRSSVSIVGGGGNKPTLTAASSNNAVVSGWTSIAVALGDTIEFNLDSVATLTRFNLFVAIVRS